MANTLTAKINDVPVDVQQGSLSIEKYIDASGVATFTINDPTMVGNYTQFRQHVVLTDSILGKLFSGYIVIAAPARATSTSQEGAWVITCQDERYLPNKRLNFKNYTNRTAGDMVADMASTYLAAEGVVVPYATRFESSQADFAGGTLTNVLPQPSGDGDLELGSTGGTVTQSYNVPADWNAGTLTNVKVNTDGSVQLNGVIRNWTDGSRAGQDLYGNGSPTDSVSSGVYILGCTKASETRSRLTFAGLWATPFTAECDVYLGGDVPTQSITYLTTFWGNNDNGYAYAIELTTQVIQLRLGANAGSGTSSQLASVTFGTKLSPGWYRIRVVLSGSTHSIYVGGSLKLSVTDSTYSSAGYLAIRNRNGEPAISINMQSDNFGVMKAKSGIWQSPSISINSVTTVASSRISWDPSLSQGGTILVQTSTNGGTTWKNCTNGGSIPDLGPGSSGTGKSLLVKVNESVTSTQYMPIIRSLSWVVSGGYVSSGSRHTLPLAIDFMNRANQALLGTASDGQTYAEVGTGTSAIAAGVATIANTTGIVFEHLGSKTAADSESSIEFQLGVSTISPGLVLRYVDANNWYAAVVTPTSLTLYKCVAGAIATLASAAIAISLATWYRLRFRIVGVPGTGPATLAGHVWTDQTVEPGGPVNPQWTVVGFD